MSVNMAILIVQLLFSLSIIFYGLEKMFEDWRFEASIEAFEASIEAKDEPFSKYQNLEDCIQDNLNKRDPAQYCRAIRRKVQRARRRKRGG